MQEPTVRGDLDILAAAIEADDGWFTDDPSIRLEIAAQFHNATAHTLAYNLGLVLWCRDTPFDARQAARRLQRLVDDLTTHQLVSVLEAA